MSEHEADRLEQPQTGNTGEPGAEAEASPSRRRVRRTLWQRLRLLMLRAAAFFGAMALFGVLLTAGSAWYTSRPQFCRSCHIMEPYYASWQESTHSDVTCIKCHFPPGVAEEVRGKMLGLVQLAKYVTQSQGPRPMAEVSDASCLRSGCHETRTLAGEVDFHGIPFNHTPHLENLRRGKKLRCTSCHSQIVQGSHMTVTPSTCFLCHFKEGRFNEGIGACTRCHQIPEEEFQLAGGLTFSHELAFERGVDCAFCHSDLIRGDGSVPPERCGVCHNRKDQLERREDHQFIHDKHVTEHKVDCLDCHLEIHHSLDQQKTEHAASNCASCHPDHHREQVNLIEGIGGKTTTPHGGAMSAVRVDCRACHRMQEVSATGSVLWKASVLTCAECHDDGIIDRVKLYHNDMQTALSDLQAEVGRLREALRDGDLAEDRLADATSRLDDLDDDLEFLSVGKGIHNVHYASSLTAAVLEQLRSLCAELEIDLPNITLPELVE